MKSMMDSITLKAADLKLSPVFFLLETITKQ